jgi:hypothetical protein
VSFRFCDEGESWFGWVAAGRIPRTSHALAVEGRVWLVDPVAWVEAEERARSLGTPAGVIQLLDRHNRDCAQVASRLDVPLHRVPDRVDAPFEFVRVVNLRVWQELALWWPERRVLVTADALGTTGYFTLGGEKIGLHPLLRPFPPDRLRRLDPDVVLVGHGEGIRDASAPFREALSSPLRRVLRLPARLRGTGG